MAIAGLIFGIFGLFFELIGVFTFFLYGVAGPVGVVLSILGLIFSFLGLKGQKSVAVGGIIVSTLALIFGIFMIVDYSNFVNGIKNYNPGRLFR